MSKLTDTLKAALAKKQGKHHLENEDGVKLKLTKVKAKNFNYWAY